VTSTRERLKTLAFTSRGLTAPADVASLTWSQIERLVVVGLGEQNLDGANDVECTACDARTSQPHTDGWKFTTQYDGDARWLCRECYGNSEGS
jgi:hypothetical protein